MRSPVPSATISSVAATVLIIDDHAGSGLVPKSELHGPPLAALVDG
jgi:hypothetical protein